MELWQALILGIVEGLTEYLPVSSTGHLLVVQRMLGIPESDAANAYAIAIQAGAIVAVLGLYRRRVAQMALGVAGRDAPGAKLAMCVVVAFVPAAIVGLALDDIIEGYLFGPWPIVAAWVVGGLVILWFARRKPGAEGLAIEGLTWRSALIIGAIQCIAMWPGVSRSLATILGGVLVGLSLPAAVEFSFLLGLVTLGAATAYKTLQHGDTMLEAYGPLAIAVGFVAAWLAAIASVRFMVAWLNERGLGLFAWWRFGAAAVVATMVLAGLL
ncbi:MAG: undecaprenyl-diphosphate phosphatase [Myxococcota bacterium]|nr:undecaprenyl-diphosphate phosphatase [Myxococcota bacterium]